MIPVWPFDYEFGAEAPIKFDETVIELGAGHFRTAMRGLAHTQPDGVGGVGNHVGVREFTIFIEASYAEAQQWIIFLRDRKNANLEPFYFYWKYENDDQSTWTGDVPSAGTNSQGQAVTNETGRYLAIQVGDISQDWGGPAFDSRIGVTLRQVAA